jgi:hypothetical protein
MSAPDNYYNLLVQGFRAGQLSLKRDAPPALARLAASSQLQNESGALG